MTRLGRDYKLVEGADGRQRVVQKKKRVLWEELIQRPLVKRLGQLEGFTRRLLVIHVPNQLLRSKALRRLYSGLGVRAGVTDLIIPIDADCPHCRRGRTLWIELKHEKNKVKRGKAKTSADQDKFQADMRRLGHLVYVVQERNAQAAIDAVEQILRDNGITDFRLREAGRDETV